MSNHRDFLMSMDFRHFLTKAAFVLSWYGFGAAAAIWIVHDAFTANRHVMPALKAGWPIIALFFSVIGLVLYLTSCRPPGIGRKHGEETKQYHSAFVADRGKKVVGSDIHCVAGDGLDIISAIVVCRWLGLSFWPEFWIRYAVGFLFGWFIFQYGCLRAMGAPPKRALWNGGRVEFFSMMTVMLGMGLVKRYVTPVAAGSRPRQAQPPSGASPPWACWPGPSSPVP
jgi:hypothetical protein